ncbi:DUF4179 domain-containing protein [Paenibacillus sp. tmac-D7]|uniref:DUF4179 domain-containing protein n=1 Tax=Paenibacillus sp. tmac-D7 TaxID=2591462 RepID=UPI001142770F|nr:DUF4179 domain-containing protein [Paenibacillus sp. tmac-D7]
MKSDHDLKRSLEQAFDRVPDSLYQFVDELPDRFEKGEFEHTIDLVATKRRFPRWMPFMSKSAAAAVILVLIFSAGVTLSPAFASFVKMVPAFEVAVDWLTQIRERDGVQTAVNHGYIPIEPVTAQLGGTTITISDMYLTDEELLFKAFIRTDEFDVSDNHTPVHLFISPGNLRGGGSTTASSIARTTDGSNTPIRQDTYKYQLENGAAEQFLAKGDPLTLKVNKSTLDRVLKRSEMKELGTITVPIDPSKLLHNKVYEPKQTLSFSDLDWKELTLEKLTIQPTTMNVIMKGQMGWDLYFPREDDAAPYLKDDKGNVYRYDPSGTGIILEEGKQQLPFSSSVFFDPSVRKLYLHIGELRVTEREPSASFELSMDDTFPKTVRFKNRDIVIEGAEYHPEGYMHLKIRKEAPDQRFLDGVWFDIAEKEDMTAKFDKEDLAAYEAFTSKLNELMESLNASGFGSAEDYRNMPYLSAYILAPKLEKYTITMSRANDRIVVNKDYPIQLNTK